MWTCQIILESLLRAVLFRVDLSAMQQCLLSGVHVISIHNSIELLQVIRCGPVGDRHLGGTAVPGHVQRASAALCHGGRTPGQTRQLPRHAVSLTHLPFSDLTLLWCKNLSGFILDHPPTPPRMSHSILRAGLF